MPSRSVSTSQARSIGTLHGELVVDLHELSSSSCEAAARRGRPRRSRGRPGSWRSRRGCAATSARTRSAAPSARQRRHPVDRLGHARRLVQVEPADPPDELRWPSVISGSLARGHRPAQDLGGPLRRREVDPVVEAAAAQRVVQLAAAVGGQHHDRRRVGGERAELRDGDRGLAEELEQQRLELVVGPVDLVDQQHRRRPARCAGPPAGSARSCRNSSVNRSASASGLVPGLGQPDRQQLALVVPLVERLAGGQALVALQPDQRRAQRRRQRLGRRGLADPGLALQQQRLPRRQRQEQRRRQPVVDQVVDARPAAGVPRSESRITPGAPAAYVSRQPVAQNQWSPSASTVSAGCPGRPPRSSRRPGRSTCCGSVGGARPAGRGRARRPAHGLHDLGQDGQRDLLRGAGADVQPDRGVHPGPLVVGELELVEHRRAAPPAGDQRR